MLGVDYSPQSVRFARRIERARRKGLASGSGGEESGDGGGDGDGDGGGTEKVGEAEEGVRNTQEEDDDEDEGDEEEEIDVHFAEHDILHNPATALLDARFSPSVVAGWDVVLDKGTFDAVSLSAETLLLDPAAAAAAATATANDTISTSTTSSAAADTSAGPRPRRVNEAYGARILPLVREGGLFLVTSCNWTEAELRSWFEDGAVQEIPATATATAITAASTSTSTSSSSEGGSESQEQQKKEKKKSFWGFQVVGRVEYRSFSFGGVKGQTISTLCFRKVRKEGIGRERESA